MLFGHFEAVATFLGDVSCDGGGCLALNVVDFSSWVFHNRFTIKTFIRFEYDWVCRYTSIENIHATTFIELYFTLIKVEVITISHSN